jgi:hypothetical protein
MTEHLSKIDVQRVGEVIDEFKKNAQVLIPDQSQVKQSAENLRAALKDKWDDLDMVEETKAVDKLAKTLIKALVKAKDAVSEEFAEDAAIWSQRLNRVQEKFQNKWTKVLEQFQDKNCDDDDQQQQKQKQKQQQKQQHQQQPEEKMSSENSSTSWIFNRAEKRDENRKETRKSDWIFDRATDRKRFHKLLTDAEWNDRRNCDDKTEDCETIDKVRF